MRTRPVPLLLAATVLFAVLGRHGASAQAVRVEAGGGWAIPSSEITMTGTVGGGGTEAAVEVNPGPGPNVYGAVGLVWTLTDDLSLETRLRAQQSRMRVGAEDFSVEVQSCDGSCPDGRLRAISFEGQLTLTSVGRINPYFLVGLGVVRTTLDGVRIPAGNTEVQLSEVDVTDAGGDVGFGATTRLVGGLYLTAETRVTGSLPGAKDNAVTTFPFTLGLSYAFGGPSD